MNAHALFVGAITSQSYHQAIQLPEKKARALRDADRRLRATMRRAAENTVSKGEVMVLASQAFRDARQVAPSFEVKFLLQGGMAYKTAVHPASLPPQQCDRDTGVYVKTSYLDRDTPGIASKKFFDLVERAIKPLCDQEGWKIIEKDTCVRVEIAPDLHIDYPLYAIPDDEFATMAAAMSDATGEAFDIAKNRMSEVLKMFPNLRIPADRVMLAHREFGWMQSDPRALHDWFEKQFARYPGLRRQCRYWKGWRDFAFAKGGPSSVLLMVCVANAYIEGLVKADADRDDAVFLKLVGIVANMLRGDVLNPVLDTPTTLNNWDDVERQRIVKAVESLDAEMNSALNGHYHACLTIQRLRAAFGDRVPNRPDLVKIEQGAPEVAATVSAAPASPLPQVRRTTSG